MKVLLGSSTGSALLFMELSPHQLLSFSSAFSWDLHDRAEWFWALLSGQPFAHREPPSPAVRSCNVVPHCHHWLCASVTPGFGMWRLRSLAQ